MSTSWPRSSSLSWAVYLSFKRHYECLLRTISTLLRDFAWLFTSMFSRWQSLLLSAIARELEYGSTSWITRLARPSFMVSWQLYASQVAHLSAGLTFSLDVSSALSALCLSFSIVGLKIKSLHTLKNWSQRWMSAMRKHNKLDNHLPQQQHSIFKIAGLDYKSDELMWH